MTAPLVPSAPIRAEPREHQGLPSPSSLCAPSHISDPTHAWAGYWGPQALTGNSALLRAQTHPSE